MSETTVELKVAEQGQSACSDLLATLRMIQEASKYIAKKALDDNHHDTAREFLDLSRIISCYLTDTTSIRYAQEILSWQQTHNSSK